MTSRTINQTPAQPYLKHLRDWWSAATQPSAKLHSEDARQAQLVAGTLFVLAPLALVGTFVGPLINLIQTGTWLWDASILLGTIASLFILTGYGLSRTVWYKGAAWIAVLSVPLATLGPAFILGFVGDPSTYAFNVLAVVMAALLLSSTRAFVIGFVISIVVLFAPQVLIADALISANVSAFLLVSMTTIVVGLMARHREYYVGLLQQAQIEVQTANAQLQEQVEVTEEARAEAEHSNQVKSAFLASMSHELRTPLNAVINFTKFVAQGDVGSVSDDQRDMLYEVVDSAKHLLNLINDVLDMSKIESGSLNLFIQDDIDLQEIVDTVVVTGRSLIAEKPVTIRNSAPENLPLIRADKQRIRQILLNIMSNACKFTSEGYVEVRADVKGDDIIIAIEDTGPGIAPDGQEAVFEPFQQTDSGLRQGGGTGLGMPISKNLAEIHGGKLWLESEIGKGTTFFVQLPIKSSILTPLLV